MHWQVIERQDIWQQIHHLNFKRSFGFLLSCSLKQLLACHQIYQLCCKFLTEFHFSQQHINHTKFLEANSLYQHSRQQLTEQPDFVLRPWIHLL